MAEQTSERFRKNRRATTVKGWRGDDWDYNQANAGAPKPDAPKKEGVAKKKRR